MKYFFRLLKTVLAVTLCVCIVTSVSAAGLFSEGIVLPPIEFDGHTVVIDTAVAPTCTESGLTEGSHCSNCGKVLVAQQTVAPLGHDLLDDEAVPATCTEQGKEAGKHCSRCDYTEAGAVIEALGHAWDEGVVTKEPTFEAEGEKTFTCTRCDATKTEPIAKLTGDPCEDYTDIDRKAWYHAAADFVIAGGYMGSTQSGKMTFEPTTKVSRAMIAQIMYKICGNPSVDYEGKFTDVKDGQWYTKAVEWCAQNGLAAGSNGKFNPNGNVTRQELTVFMRSLARYLGKDITGSADLTGFPDASKVPNWAKEAVAWAVDYGIISGQKVGDLTYLNPTAGATRAELAAILRSFLTK